MRHSVELSPTEWEIAKEYCFGQTDKEVANRLKKPIWTIKTHKRNIFKKLCVSTTHEMVIYCICIFLNINWDIQRMHNEGLAIFL